MSRPEGAAPRLLLSVFAGFGVGGQQVRFASLANRLGPAWRHAIVAMDGNLACRERLDPGLDAAFPAINVSGGPPGLHRRLRAALRTLRPDLLLTHNWGSMDWALANAAVRRIAPHLHAEDGFGPEERARQLCRRVWARRLVLRRSTVVVPSNALLDIAERRWRLAPASLRHVPNGIDLARFAACPDPGPPPAEWGLAPGGPVVGTVAALRPEKNIARLLHAVAQCAVPVRLAVVGDGPERASLERLAAELLPPGRVAFLGHTPDPAPAYRHMDIFALASDTEQMPLSLLEAMASGLPAAATAVGDVAGMLSPENRPLATPPGTAGLAASLALLASDPALRRRLGDANRARAQARFDERDMIARWAGLLADAR